MVASVRIKTNAAEVLKKFESKLNVLREDVANEPGVVAHLGQQLGRSLAPRDTGTLINAIDWKQVSKQKTGGTAMVWVRPLVNPKGGSARTKGRASAYAAIHHALPLGAHSQGQARTNDPHWMFTVKRELKRRYGTKMVGHIQRFI